MRKYYVFLATLAAGLFAFSCAKEADVVTKPEETKTYEYIFRISEKDSEPTKTLIDGTTVQWESGDRIGVYATGTVNKYGSISSLNPVQFPIYLASALSAGDKIYCYYPYNKDANDSNNANEITLTIPASQNGNFDAMPQVSLPYTVSADMADGTHNVDDVYFCNIGSIARFLVYSSTGAFDDETVESIKFTANTGLAGSVSFDLTAVDYDDPSTLATTGYASLSATTTESPAIGTNTANAGVANLVIAPGTYFGTVILLTDKARYTYTIAEENKITFARSAIKKLGLDLESATCSRVEIHPVDEVFVPATSIAAGDKILITSGTSGTVGVIGVQNTNNRTAVNYTISDGIIVSNANTYPLTVGTGETVDTYYTLYDPTVDGYLYAAASGNNYLKSEAAVTVDSEWQITLDGTSKATKFEATGSENKNLLRYNSSNKLFSCYGSGQNDVYVFKKVDGTFVTAADQDIAYTVTSVTIDYNVYNGSGSTTVAFKTNPGDCASNLAINEGTKKVTFDITANDGSTRTVEVNITNNGVTKTVSINQAAAPSKLVMSTITAAPAQTQIVFSWDAVDDAEGYQISIDGGKTYGSTQAGTSYTWTGLTAFTEYTIKVKAIGDGIYHMDSDAASKTQKTTLAVPTGITWTKATKTVTWTDTNTSAGTYATDYKYQFTIDNGETFTDVAAPGNSVVLSITETKAIKIKAVYITDATLNSALSDGTSCLVGADPVYTATFEGSSEHRTEGNNSYTTNEYTVSSVVWNLVKADCVTTGTPLAGAANIICRVKGTANNGSVTTQNVLSASKTIKKVTFLSKLGTNVTMTLKYSTDGTSWTTLTYAKDTNVDETNGYSATVSDVVTSDFRLKWEYVTSDGNKKTTNRDSQLDNVIVYGE